MQDSRIPFTGEDHMLSVGAHVCAMHDDPARVLSTLSEALRTGLQRGERGAFIAPESAAEEVRRSLAAGGADVAEAESRGDLVFITDRQALLKNGNEFDPDHLLEAVKGLFSETIEAGYAGLRLSADVPWLSRNVPGGERALEFEAKADEIVNVEGVPLMAICQYSLSELDPEDTIDILERHPLTLVGGEVHVNDKYSG